MKLAYDGLTKNPKKRQIHEIEETEAEREDENIESQHGPDEEGDSQGKSNNEGADASEYP